MMARHMKMDANSWLLRSTWKNGQKRNAPGFPNGAINQANNHTLWAIAA